jgi:hypothetical protein
MLPKLYMQVSSVGNLALNIASLGSAGAATAAQEAGKLTDLKSSFQQMKDAAKASEAYQEAYALWKASEPARDVYKFYKAADIVVEAAEVNNYSPEEMVRAAALIASIADPTGVASVVAAYSYPKCSALVALGR